jgi:hypothetical protein
MTTWFTAFCSSKSSVVEQIANRPDRFCAGKWCESRISISAPHRSPECQALSIGELAEWRENAGGKTTVAVLFFDFGAEQIDLFAD